MTYSEHFREQASHLAPQRTAAVGWVHFISEEDDVVKRNVLRVLGHASATMKQRNKRPRKPRPNTYPMARKGTTRTKMEAERVTRTDVKGANEGTKPTNGRVTPGRKVDGTNATGKRMAGPHRITRRKKKRTKLPKLPKLRRMRRKLRKRTSKHIPHPVSFHRRGGTFPGPSTGPIPTKGGR